MTPQQRAAFERLCEQYAPPLAPLPVRLARFVGTYRALRTVHPVKTAARIAWQIEVNGTPF